MKIRNIILFLLVMVFTAFTNAETKLTVVLDAGHGGKDSGAVGLSAKEKDIALRVVLALGKKIKEEFKDVEALYTRNSDKFLELWQRTQFANEKKGNLFMSIHCNSSKYNPSLTKQPYGKPSGFETYVMGLGKSDRSLEIAMKENSAILQEDNYVEMYAGFDPNDPDAYIVMANMQNGLFGHLDMSTKFASLIQQCMKNNVSYPDRKVQQAPFRVLYGLRMPSVLVEIGFINNPEEETFMNSAEGEKKIVDALFNAFAEYRKSVDVESGNHISANSNSVESRKSQDTTLRLYDSTTSAKPAPPVQSAVPAIVIYKVQFATAQNNKQTFVFDIKEASPVAVYYHNGLYKYTAGEFDTIEDAKKLQDKIRQQGYKDAFVVKFVNGTRQ